MKYLLLLSSILAVTVPTNQALAKCDISNYIFQDQKGNEAVVKSIKECFGWFDRDNENPRLSSKQGQCFKEKRASNVVKILWKRHKLDRINVVGTRIFSILYKDRFINISETESVGSPWLTYEVDPDLHDENLASYKNSGKIYSLIGSNEVKFDFTKDAPEGLGTPKELYKSLLGVQLIFKRCKR